MSIAEKSKFFIELLEEERNKKQVKVVFQNIAGISRKVWEVTGKLWKWAEVFEVIGKYGKRQDKCSFYTKFCGWELWELGEETWGLIIAQWQGEYINREER